MSMGCERLIDNTKPKNYVTNVVVTLKDVQVLNDPVDSLQISADYFKPPVKRPSNWARWVIIGLLLFDIALNLYSMWRK